jgi:hypothetical protein
LEKRDEVAYQLELPP